MKVRTALALVVTSLLAVVSVAVPAAAAPPRADAGIASVPVRGSDVGTDGALHTVEGTFQVTQFAVEDGQLVAQGVFTGTVDGVARTVSGSSVVTVAQSSCRILELTLGPLHLDLLGLVIDLDEVNLVITAEPGPGNLLGNLLCAIAGLLDGSAVDTALARLVDLLNAILALL